MKAEKLLTFEDSTENFGSPDGWTSTPDCKPNKRDKMPLQEIEKRFIRTSEPEPYPGTYNTTYEEENEDNSFKSAPVVPTVEEMLKNIKLTKDEQLHPVRALGKIKREECRNYFIGLGFTKEQAKAVCRSMNPVMAGMIIKSRYPSHNELQQVLARIMSRLRKINVNSVEIDVLQSKFTDNIALPI